MRKYKEFEIWKKAKEIGKRTIEIADNMERSYFYVFGQHICKTGFSIISNIAEGASRSSEKDFKRFLEISLGSAYELESQLILLSESGKIPEKEAELLLKLLVEEEKQISSFINKLKANSQ